MAQKGNQHVRIQSRKWKTTNGGKEGDGCKELANPNKEEASTMLSGILQFLLKIHQKLCQDSGTAT